MKWFAVDASFPGHRKLQRARKYNRDAPLMWLAMRGHVAREENAEGRVHDDEIDCLGGAPPSPRKALDALVRAELLERVEEGDDIWWHFHDFEDHAKELDVVLRKRDKEREKKRRQRDRRRDINGNPPGCPPGTDQGSPPGTGSGPSQEGEREEERDLTGRGRSKDLSGQARTEDAGSSPPQRARPRHIARLEQTFVPGQFALPGDWKPKPRHIERASAAGVPCAVEADKFSAHARARGRVAADWDSEFDLWLLRAAERLRTERGAQAGDPGEADPEATARRERDEQRAKAAIERERRKVREQREGSGASEPSESQARDFVRRTIRGTT